MSIKNFEEFVNESKSPDLSTEAGRKKWLGTANSKGTINYFLSCNEDAIAGDVICSFSCEDFYTNQIYACLTIEGMAEENDEGWELAKMLYKDLIETGLSGLERCTLSQLETAAKEEVLFIDGDDSPISWKEFKDHPLYKTIKK